MNTILANRAIALALSSALAAMSGAVAPVPALAQTAANAMQSYSIPAGSLKDALDALASQGKVSVLFPPDLVANKRTQGLSGRHSLADALERLLSGSGLEAEATNDRTVVIRKAPTAPPPASPRQTPRPQPQAKSAVADEPVTELQRLAVTGTRVKGAELTSPLVMITSEDMRLSGHPSMGDVLRMLPQNFSGGQNPGVVGANAGGGISNQNVTSGSSFNLRGLGPDATLTLLNGTRLPYDGWGQLIDIDAIPVSAVERVEVLLDGASAIYGSDAVAGVVNVILKRDYSGAEVSARVGTATSGGFAQAQYTGVAGTTWDSGGLIVTGSFARNTPASAGQRRYLANVPAQHDIYPGIDQKSTVLSVHQDMGESAELAVDAFYSDRDAHHNNRFSEERWALVRSGATSWGVNPSMVFSLHGDMSLRLHAAFGRSRSRNMNDIFSFAAGRLEDAFKELFDNKNTALGVEFTGSFAQLPAGSVGYSVGGGYRKSTFGMEFDPGGNAIDSKSNKSTYAYAEIDVPLVAESQSVPFVRQLSINGAMRQERYDSFGRSTTPKIGVFWSVNSSLDFKASWGRSFKAPTLLQQYQQQGVVYDPSAIYDGGPEDRTVIYLGGGNPGLGPEEATVTSLGLVFKPASLDGMRVEMNWFDIDYSNRVVNPIRNFTSALVDPLVQGYRILNPSLDQINRLFEQMGREPGDFAGANRGNPDGSPRPWNPLDVFAIVDDRYVNAVGTRIRGIDLSSRYAMDFLSGVLALSASGNWVTDATRRISPTAPDFPNAGLMFTPAKFKGRVSAAWSRDAFTVSTAVNHTSGVLNDLIALPVKGDAMTTVDLVLDYWMDSERLGEWGVNFAVINLLNQRAPYAERLEPLLVPYDATNYSALGRVVNLTLTKRF